MSTGAQVLAARSLWAEAPRCSTVQAPRLDIAPRSVCSRSRRSVRERCVALRIRAALSVWGLCACGGYTPARRGLFCVCLPGRAFVVPEIKMNRARRRWCVRTAVELVAVCSNDSPSLCAHCLTRRECPGTASAVSCAKWHCLWATCGIAPERAPQLTAEGNVHVRGAPDERPDPSRRTTCALCSVRPRPSLWGCTLRPLCLLSSRRPRASERRVMGAATCVWWGG